MGIEFDKAAIPLDPKALDGHGARHFKGKCYRLAALVGVVCVFVTPVALAETRFVEYLQGDGRAYIDTGFTLDNTCRVELDFMYGAVSDSMIYGSRTSMHTTDAHISGLTASSDEIVTFFVNGTAAKRPCRVQNASRHASCRLRIDNGVEGTFLWNLTTGTVLAQSTTSVSDVFTTPGTCHLFSASGSGWSQNKFPGRIYSFRVYRGGVLSADFRPCVKDGVPGMVNLKDGRAFFASFAERPHLGTVPAIAAADGECWHVQVHPQDQRPHLLRRQLHVTVSALQHSREPARRREVVVGFRLDRQRIHVGALLVPALAFEDARIGREAGERVLVGLKEFSPSGRSVVDSAAVRAERQLLRLRVKSWKETVRHQRRASA